MRRLGSLLSILGMLALLAGLILNFLVVPRLAQLPDDTDSMISYEGTLATALNPTALAENDLPNLFLSNVPVTVDRHVRVLETDGGKALVRSTADVLDPAGNTVNGTDSWYTVDRGTMLSIDNFTDDPNPIPREGLVTGFPIGTEQRDYLGWNGESEKTTPLTFVGEEERQGRDVYHFNSTNEPDQIAKPDPASLPPSLPKAQLAGLVGALGLPEETAVQLSAALELAPDPVPLNYTFSSESDFYVDPATGILIDYNTTESRVAGITIAGGFQPLTEVWNLSFEQSDESIQTAIDDADSNGSTLFWYGKFLPWALIIGGILLALFGLWTRTKNKPAVDGVTDTDGLLDRASDTTDDLGRAGRRAKNALRDRADDSQDIVDDLKDRW